MSDLEVRLKRIYENSGRIALEDEINSGINYSEYTVLQGHRAKEKAEALIRKWVEERLEDITKTSTLKIITELRDKALELQALKKKMLDHAERDFSKFLYYCDNPDIKPINNQLTEIMQDLT